MRMLRSTESELNKSVAYKKKCAYIYYWKALGYETWESSHLL